jgi:hypothetical protein
MVHRWLLKNIIIMVALFKLIDFGGEVSPPGLSPPFQLSGCFPLSGAPLGNTVANSEHQCGGTHGLLAVGLIATIAKGLINRRANGGI